MPAAPIDIAEGNQRTPSRSWEGAGGRAGLALLLLTLSSCTPLVPELDQAGAEKLLSGSPAPLILDVRLPEAPAKVFDRWLPGAIPLELGEVDGYLAHAMVPKERPVLVVCHAGTTSKVAGLVAKEAGYDRVYSLRDGMKAWKGGQVMRPARPSAELRAPRRLEASRLEQVATVVLGIGVKSTYMALSALLIVLLWRSRERGLVLVRQSMIAFLFGEGMCAVNYLFASGASDPIEVMHGLGMLAMGALLPLGLFRLADDRVVRYEDPAATCAVQRFCGHCWKREAVPCGLQRLFLFAAPALAVTSLIPLCAPIVPLRIETTIFGSSVVSQVGAELQLLEFRLYPLLACVLFTVSFALLWGGRSLFAYARSLFFAGLGLMSFSVMRFFLFRTFRDRILWADAWEEATEFVAIAFVLFLLYVFRRQLEVLRFLTSREAPLPPAKADQA
ncbi:MAG TPA: rhodanese-like domain-containing protein [Myxococcales bacterium]